MCTHCEATVKKALEALPEVETAAVSCGDGPPLLTLRAEVDEAALRRAIEDEDYTFVSVT